MMGSLKDRTINMLQMHFFASYLILILYIRLCTIFIHINHTNEPCCNINMLLLRDSDIVNYATDSSNFFVTFTRTIYMLATHGFPFWSSSRPIDVNLKSFQCSSFHVNHFLEGKHDD